MPLFSRVAALTSVSMFMGATAKAMMEGPKVEAHEAIYDPKKKTSFKINFEPYVLGEKLMLAEDVALLRFLLHNPDDVFDLKPCSTLQSRHSTGGNRIEQVQRAYTPITPFGTKGYFDIIVKKQHHGRMTEHLFSMEPGEKLEFRVAVHKLHYVPNRWKYMGAIAGGTGISSVLQVIREVCDNPEDKTKVSLLFGNRAESKILIRSIIDGLATKHADKFKVHYCIDSTDETNKNTWKGFVGHINKEMIAKTMPPPHKENLILVCGPDSMMQSVVGLSAATLKAMSGGLPHQPLGSGINNMNTTIEGYLGELGYLGLAVHYSNLRFSFS